VLGEGRLDVIGGSNRQEAREGGGVAPPAAWSERVYVMGEVKAARKKGLSIRGKSLTGDCL